MRTPSQLNAVAVIGNGLIGHGVAQVFASAGIPVRMIGRRQASLTAALDKIRESLKLFETEAVISAADARAALARILLATSRGICCAEGHAGLVRVMVTCTTACASMTMS